MISTYTYCHGESGYCDLCGRLIVSPDQMCGDSVVNLDEPVELDEALSRRDWRTVWQYADSRMRYYQRRAEQPKNKARSDDENIVNAKQLARLVAVFDKIASDASVDPDEPIRLGVAVTRREWGMILDAAHWRRIHHDEKLDQLDRLEPLIARAAGEEV